MAYPADSSLFCNKVADFLNKTIQDVTIPLTVNMKKISSTVPEYFFFPKSSTTEVKDEKLMSLRQVIQEEVNPVINICEDLNETQIKKMPCDQKRTINQIKESAIQYIKEVYLFLTEDAMVPTKRISFHLKKVVCITKGKLGKKYQFGRIKRNFLFGGNCTSTHMPKKTSLVL